MKNCEKLAAIRKLMAEKNIDTYLVLSSDAHQSEYVSPYWRARAFMSEFTGSAGTFLVTKDEAAVWVDGRYFLQGEEQTKGTDVQLMKMGEPGVPTYTEWMIEKTPENGVIGVDGRTIGHAQVLQLEPLLAKKGLTLSVKQDLVGDIWTDRPALPQDPIFDFSAELSGETRAARLTRLRAHMAETGADYYLIASLESSAWLLNFRGNDVQDTPVALAFTLVGKDSCTLFIDENKVASELKAAFLADGVQVAGYDDVPRTLASLPVSTLACDTRLINQLLFESIPEGWTILNENPDAIILMKAVKNETELKNVRLAHVKDGAVMVRFLKWVKEAIAAGEDLDEVDVAEHLDDMRRSQENSLGISFGTIAGYGSNGAIVHYGPQKGSCAKVKPEGFLLVDSGAQYLEGTTDITRTIAMGPLSDEMKTAYTLVLKGHLALGHARFKEGITGTNLDVLARKPLWDHDLDYKHGTGHGVGFVLSVHEGPQNISFGLNAIALKPGMIISDEPGYYPTGKFGVRIENLVEVKQGNKNEWGQFDYLESITLCPYEKEAIDLSLLSGEEIDQINEYHQRVYREIAPLLAGEPEVLCFLKEQTSPLQKP